MNKVKSMLRPSDFWNIGEHESWFSDMAQEGLHLKKVGFQFVKFTKGKPKQMKYRIDVSQGKKIVPEQKEMYSESGWDYVTSYGEFNVFSSPVEANAPELHTDPAEQAYTLKRLDKKFAKNAIIIAIAAALGIGMLVAVWFHHSTHYLALVEGIIIQQATLIIMELYVVYNSLQAAISIRALRKTLSEGKPINHTAPWKRQHKLKLIVASFYIALAIFGAILPVIQLVMSDTKTLPVASSDLPIVRLADVEQNTELTRESSSHIRDNIDWGNRYSYDWSLFAPLQYQSDERGVVPNEMWKDGSGAYSPSISTWAYKINFSYMNEGVLSDLIKRYGMKYEGGDFIEMKHTYFDKLVVHEVNEFKEVFASKGKAVMYVRYHGYADIDSIIEATVEKMNLISD
ncbi:MAG TPA: DUF2812 domain-containing protein [Ruminiclostridium sp.]